MPNGTNASPVGPVYGGDGGGKSCVVHAHSLPRRASRCSRMSVDAQRGQESCDGNVTISHAPQRLPISRGSSEGQVNRRSAIGTRAIRDSNEDLERSPL